MTDHAASSFASSVDAPDGAPNDIGVVLHNRITDLYPICRSITGPGVRETLKRIARDIPLDIHEVPTGTKVFDWDIPKEWAIQDAYVADNAGNRVIDFQRHNLHVVGYSQPVRTRMSLQDLKARLHTDPDKPDWIPYRTSYYNETWGFCMAHNAMLALPDGDYDVVIDASLYDGAMTYAECVIPGATTREILVSTSICHPSMANDNLSGVTVAVEFARALLAGPKPLHTVRVLFMPGTIGAITWLARNENRLFEIDAGIILSNLGDPGPMHYKKSRRGNADVDRAAGLVLADQPGSGILEFEPYGYDERQFCSPGINLAVGCLSRTPYGQFPEYHTSADTPDFVQPEALAASLETLLRIFRLTDGNRRYRNLNPLCEPMLGRRGLYGAMGGRARQEDLQMAMLWVLNLSDGGHSLLDIAEKSGLAFDTITEAVTLLEQFDLLEPL